MSRPKVNFEKMIIIVKTCVIMKYLPYLEVVDLKIFTRDINTGPYSTHKTCRALKKILFTSQIFLNWQ